MGFGLPVLVAVAVGAAIKSIPTQIIGPLPAPIDISYSSSYKIPVAAPSQTLAFSYADQLFGDYSSSDLKYVGKNYTQLKGYVVGIASSGHGPPSAQAVAYDSLANFTVMYNASYPMDYAAVVDDLLYSAVNNVTNNLLFVSNDAQQMPVSEVSNQVHSLHTPLLSY